MKISPISTPVKNFVSNPRIAEFAENTFISLSIQTGLKMAGRPGFILIDKKADSKTKKYAAIKEFSYQAICFGLYLSAVPFVKKFVYNMLSKNLSSKGLENAEKIKAYNDHKHKIQDLYDSSKKQIKATKDKYLKAKMHENLLNKANELKAELKTNKKFHLGKGATELSAIIASIIVLAVAAPQIGTALIHPTMRFLGFERRNSEIDLNKGVK